MAAEVYIIKDRNLIEYIEDNNIDGFKEYLSNDDTILFDEPIQFESEAEALAFCRGIGYGMDERMPIEKFPLRSFEEFDRPFIEAIENY